MSGVAKKLPPLSRLKELFELTEDGRLFWKKCGNLAMVGKRAGDIGNDGYWRVKVDKSLYRLHRIVFYMANGREPVGKIDHINRTITDNRPCNLREVTNRGNGLNAKLNKKNTSGFTGVYKCGLKWRALAYVDMKPRQLGSFNTFSEACEAKITWDIEHVWPILAARPGQVNLNKE